MKRCDEYRLVGPSTIHANLSSSSSLARTSSTRPPTHKLSRDIIDIKTIRTEADYQAALREVESLMTAEFETPEGARLNALATMVEAYEAK
jgi:hypothetical protein